MLTELPFQARHDGSGTQTGFAECAPGTFDSSCRVSQNFEGPDTRRTGKGAFELQSFRELAHRRDRLTDQRSPKQRSEQCASALVARSAHSRHVTTFWQDKPVAKVVSEAQVMQYTPTEDRKPHWTHWT